MTNRQERRLQKAKAKLAKARVETINARLHVKLVDAKFRKAFRRYCDVAMRSIDA